MRNKKRNPSWTPQGIADVIADDCSRCSGSNDWNDALTLVSSMQRRYHERRLAGERYPHAFERDYKRKRPVSILTEEMVKLVQQWSVLEKSRSIVPPAIKPDEMSASRGKADQIGAPLQRPPLTQSGLGGHRISLGPLRGGLPHSGVVRSVSTRWSTKALLLAGISLPGGRMA